MSAPLRIEVDAGHRDGLVGDAVRVVPLPPLAWDAHREAIVTRDGSGVLRAYLNRCKHLPVPLDGGSRDFLDVTRRYLICGTHGALYERETGYCVSGPCRGRVLDAIRLEEREDGRLVLVLEA